MGFRERFPGWSYPEADAGAEGTMDLNNAAALIMTAIPCPVCGCLVPQANAPRHIQFHKDLIASGATPKPASGA
jgi:hypothetical protein